VKPIEHIFRLISARDLVITIIGILVGGLTSWAISASFYRKAIADSQNAALKATREFNLLARGIESFGTVSYVHDAAGNVINIKIKLNATAQANSTATGTLGVTR
jgi:hypothetical protein